MFIAFRHACLPGDAEIIRVHLWQRKSAFVVVSVVSGRLEMSRTGHPSQSGYRVNPFPNLHRQQIDWLALMHRQHTIHALLEVDVTEARRSIRKYRSRTGKPLSLTAFVVWCVARAVDADRRMHACRKGRGQLVLFDDVDVTLPIEQAIEGKRIPVPYIIRAANKKDRTAIYQEIRTAQREEAPQALAVRWLPLWLLLPGFLRRSIWTACHRRRAGSTIRGPAQGTD